MLENSRAINIDDILTDLKKRRQNVVDGGVNCVPLPFRRFRREVPGMEKEQYVIVTGGTKSSKTQFMSRVYIYNTLEFAFNNPDKVDPHFIYFAREESPERITHRYMSYLLMELDGIRIAPSDLRSTNSDRIIPDHILDLLDTPRYKERLDFFRSHIQFETTGNPSEVIQICENYAMEHGHFQKYRDGEVIKTGKYVPNNKNSYYIMIYDHIGKTDVYSGKTLKYSIDKMSDGFRYLRNTFFYTCVVVQQQSVEIETVEAIKARRFEPSINTLADSKYTAQDANLILGVFYPDRIGIKDWYKYDITRLRGTARFISKIADRDGESGGVCPLLFDGATCHYEELPLPKNMTEEDYKKAEKLLDHEEETSVMIIITERYDSI